MESFALRRGLPSDVPAMYALDRQCFAEPFAFDRSSMRRFATRATAIVVIAEAGNTLSGFVILHLLRSGEAYVVTLDVHPDLRRRGVARALMQRAESEAGDRGADRIQLHVHTGNAAAISFYERQGYLRAGRVADFYAAGVDAWTYRKEL